ncbi:unnamed protein product [Hymenolepis diminuta]|uniref:SHSP domain-containing protein n=1 Tax=Hymenolepis diminuta TaxID=6216 RepID=A0A0R3STI2_HYMDI|nr:unnamed protein product [Hymenolepis diminuta]
MAYLSIHTSDDEIDAHWCIFVERHCLKQRDDIAIFSTEMVRASTPMPQNENISQVWLAVIKTFHLRMRRTVQRSEPKIESEFIEDENGKLIKRTTKRTQVVTTKTYSERYINPEPFIAVPSENDTQLEDAILRVTQLDPRVTVTTTNLHNQQQYHHSSTGYHNHHLQHHLAGIGKRSPMATHSPNSNNGTSNGRSAHFNCTPASANR